MKTVIELPFSVTQFNFTDANFNRIIEGISTATGNVCKYSDRENFMFGYAPRFVFEDAEPMYCIGNMLYTWDALKQHLRDTWRPVNQEEQDYFCTTIA